MKFFPAVLIVFYATGSLAQNAGYDTIPYQPDNYRKQVEKFKIEKSGSGGILFLGNSITAGGNWRQMLKDSSVVNRGISGDNTYGVMARIDEVVRHKPSKIFLLIGINDLSRNAPITTVMGNVLSIASILKTALPNTQIYVQSILPVNPKVKNFPKAWGKQEAILEVNRQLAKYATALSYEYLDIHSDFMDAEGMLDAKFTYDGLHLNKAGYAHWLDFLKKNKAI